MLLYHLQAALFQLALAAADFDQKLLGAAYLFPTTLGNTGTIHTAVESAYHELCEALDTGVSKFGNFAAKSNSLSATVVSALDSHRFLDFHYTGAGLNISAGSTAHVDGNTVYRIGSVSKLFTVYTLLLNGGEAIWDRAVTDYLPELRAVSQPGNVSDMDRVQWDKVTVGALASQLSGIGRDGAFCSFLAQHVSVC
jgi:CubicO group peptidase (beta-lactamase class C family)